MMFRGLLPAGRGWVLVRLGVLAVANSESAHCILTSENVMRVLQQCLHTPATALHVAENVLVKHSSHVLQTDATWTVGGTRERYE